MILVSSARSVITELLKGVVGSTELESVTSCVSSRNHPTAYIHSKGFIVPRKLRTPAKQRVFDTNLDTNRLVGWLPRNEQEMLTDR